MTPEERRDLVLDILIATAAPVSSRSIAALIREKADPECNSAKVGSAMMALRKLNLVRSKDIQTSPKIESRLPYGPFPTTVSCWFILPSYLSDWKLSLFKTREIAQATGKTPDPVWPY